MTMASPILTTARRTFGVSSLVRVIGTGLQTVWRALKNRRDALMLARLDDRMLADIGLNRSDLRDAYAEPLWRDPTDLLAGRARDKRRYRASQFPAARIGAPSLAPGASSERRTLRTTRHAA